MFPFSSCNCLCSIHSSQVLSREWRCSWSSADRGCSNYIWVMDNFIAYQGATYIRGFTVDWFVVSSWTDLVRFIFSPQVLTKLKCANIHVYYSLLYQLYALYWNQNHDHLYLQYKNRLFSNFKSFELAQFGTYSIFFMKLVCLGRLMKISKCRCRLHV